MRYTAFYIIRGNDELAARLRQREPELDFLAGPFLWSNEQGGRNVYTFEDYANGVKRAFLAYLQHVDLGPGVIERLLEGFHIADDVFDRWWTMEVFQGLDESVADAIIALREAGHADALSQIGLPIVIKVDQ